MFVHIHIENLNKFFNTNSMCLSENQEENI